MRNPWSKKALQIYVAEGVLVALESRWERLPATLFSRAHVMSMRCLPTTRLIAVSVSCAIVLILLNGCVGVVEATAPMRVTLYDPATGSRHGEVSCHIANSLLKQFKITVALRDAVPISSYGFYMEWIGVPNGGSANLGDLVTNRNGDLNFHVHQYLGSGVYTVYFHLDQENIIQYKTDSFDFTIP